MRILSAAIIAALFTAGSLSAYAQTTTTTPAPTKTATPKPKACSKRTEAECQAPDCIWTPPTGKQKKGKCATPPKAKK